MLAVRSPTVRLAIQSGAEPRSPKCRGCNALIVGNSLTCIPLALRCRLLLAGPSALVDWSLKLRYWASP